MCVFISLLVAYCISVGYSKVFSRCELAIELKHKHNISKDQLATWVCIAYYESRYNTTAVGHTNTDRSGDHGLFQVSDIYWCSPPGIGLECGISCAQLEDDDITDDVTCVRKIYRAHQRQTGNGFSAWAVYEPYCKNNVNRFIDDCFDTTHNQIVTVTQSPYVQTTLSKSINTSTIPKISLYRPWWFQALRNSIYSGNKNYIPNNTTLRPFTFYTQQNQKYNDNSVYISSVFMQKPFQYISNSTQNQEGLVTTQNPVWFNTYKTNVYTTRKLSSTTPRLVLFLSTTPKPVWLSSTSTKSVWSSTLTPKPGWHSSAAPKPILSLSTIPKPVWPSSNSNKSVWSSTVTRKPGWSSSTAPKPILPLQTVFQSAQLNNQKTNLLSRRRQTPIPMKAPMWLSHQTNLNSSRKQTSIATQKPSWFNIQNTNSYLKRKSNLTTTLYPLWFHIQETNAYSTQNQTSTTTHKPSWYETWYKNNLVSTLFRRKQCDNCQ